MSEGKTTIDHDEIRNWAEERGGMPASVAGTGRGKKGQDTGILRLDFEPRDDALEEVSWDEFFKKFDEAKLAFLYQEETADGSTSRFHKFISRPANVGKAKSGAKSSAAKDSGKAKSAAKSGGNAKKASTSKTSASEKSASKGSAKKTSSKAAPAKKAETSKANSKPSKTKAR